MELSVIKQQNIIYDEIEELFRSCEELDNPICKKDKVNFDRRSYLITRDTWNINELVVEIGIMLVECRKVLSNYKIGNRNIKFIGINEKVRMELKYIVCSKPFSKDWGLESLFQHYCSFMNSLLILIMQMLHFY